MTPLGRDPSFMGSPRTPGSASELLGRDNPFDEAFDLRATEPGRSHKLGASSEVSRTEDIALGRQNSLPRYAFNERHKGDPDTPGAPGLRPLQTRFAAMPRPIHSPPPLSPPKTLWQKTLERIPLPQGLSAFSVCVGVVAVTGSLITLSLAFSNRRMLQEAVDARRDPQGQLAKLIFGAVCEALVNANLTAGCHAFDGLPPLLPPPRHDGGGAGIPKW